jgi:hypothetical protein
MRRAMGRQDLSEGEERGETSVCCLVGAVLWGAEYVLVREAQIVASKSPAVIVWIEHVAERQYAP